MSVGYVTTKPFHTTSRESKSAKIIDQEGMSDKVERTTKIKINGISLESGSRLMGQKIEMIHQFGYGRFRFCKTILKRI